MGARVVICLPSRDEWKAVFGYSLARMLMETFTAGEDIAVGVRMCRGSLIDQNRETLAHAALGDGATHLLWLDTDMTFPPDTLLRLLERDKGIVGCNYLRRSVSTLKPTAARDGRDAWTERDSTGLEAVDRLGFGVLMVKADVFRAMSHPWFCTAWNAEKGSHIGEDTWFCNKAREAGYTVWMDHDLSKRLGHAGEFVHRLPYAWGERLIDDDETLM